MDYKAIADKALAERARIVGERRSVNEDASLSEAEKRERFERMDADIDRLMGEAREAVEAGEREGELRDLSQRAGSLSVPTADEKRENVQDVNADIRSLLSDNVRSVDMLISPEVMERRAEVVSVTGDGTGPTTGSAGIVTPDTFVRELLASLEDASDVLATVRNISTSSGETMNWPRRVSKVSGTFQQVAENGTYPDATDGSFELFPLGAYKYGAIAEVTDEAVSDPALNVASIVAEEMGVDLAESLAALVWAGTGSNEPHGLLAGAVNSSPFAGVAAVTPDELIDLQHAIIARYRGNAKFYLNDDTAKFVRKLQDANDHYLWQPALVAGQPDRLLGSPVATDLNIPDMAASAKSVVFGDLRRAYVLRTVRAISLVRSSEYGFNRDTTALKVRWRGDGGIADPAAYAVGTHAAV